MGTNIILSYIVSAAPFSSEAGLLIPSLFQHGVLPMGCRPTWIFPTYVFPLDSSASWTAPVLPQDAVLQQQSVLACVPCEVTSPAPVQALLHSFTDPDRSLLHHKLPAGSKSPSDVLLLQHGVPLWAADGSRSTVHPIGCKGTATYGLQHSLQGNL